MNKYKRFRVFLAIGLLSVSAASLIRIFIAPLNDGWHFLNGFLYGIGIVLVLHSSVNLKRISNGARRY